MIKKSSGDKGNLPLRDNPQQLLKESPDGKKPAKTSKKEAIAPANEAKDLSQGLSQRLYV